MSQKQYGGGLGGPVVRDRTFFFGNFEQRKLDQTGLVTISSNNPGNVSTINARLASAGYLGAARISSARRSIRSTTRTGAVPTTISVIVSFSMDR